MKNEAIEVLLGRRAVRCYKSGQITQDELLTVLNAGTYAPTARGLQTPYIVAVQNTQDREEVSRLNARVVGKDTDPYHGAPTIILVFAPDTTFGTLDGAAVLTNMANAAHALGLASCWINRPREMFDMEEGKALMRKWGLDEALKGVGSLALGYVEGEYPVPAERKADYYRIV